MPAVWPGASALVREFTMQEEQYSRSDVPSSRIDPLTSALGASTRAPVESVPSDQLWRAAVLAARQAALAAADLRRALEATMSHTPPHT